MPECNAEISWIPLVDYAAKTGVSLSTLRRHIKARKIEYKIENGRYLLLDSEPRGEGAVSARFEARKSTFTMEDSRLEKLERDLRKAKEEIAELKMLIALYEEKISPQKLTF